MFDHILRQSKEKILEPLATGALKIASPTAVTVIASVVAVGAGVSASQNAHGLAFGLWLLNRLLDGLDGTMARISNRQSDLGGYLDIVLDMVAYVSIPLGLAFGVDRVEVYIAMGLLFGIFYINSATWMILSAILEKRNLGAKERGELTTVSMPTSVIEGAEAVVMYSLFLLFPQWLVFLFGLLAFLVLVTSIQHIVWAIKNLS
jgi:phosphatidylglycerophosphate synthase